MMKTTLLTCVMFGLLSVLPADNVLVGWSEVNTKYGPVMGEIIETKFGNLSRYRGIPYARPPVAELRFSYPEEPDSWVATRQATQYGSKCVQEAVNGNVGEEDCLYLNVYSPVGGRGLAVMVWIHGGSFVSGNGESVGDSMAVMESVVVVGINYRLGILGFYTDGSDALPGNAGIADQLFALRWVQTNIAAFGGDPDQVTIFGQDAGSWSVNIHMVSPSSSGLFRRAISQSGALYGAVLQTDAERAPWVARVGAQLGCGPGNHTDCMREMAADELVKAAYKMTDPHRDIRCTIGNDVLPVHPDDCWDRLVVNKADYMLGLNSDDGDFLYALSTNSDELKSHYMKGVAVEDSDFVKRASLSAFRGAGGVENINERVLTAIFNQYVQNTSDQIANFRRLLDICRDSYVLAGTIATARQQAKVVPGGTYLYYFDGYFPYPDIVDNQNIPTTEELDFGAGHAAELAYVMGWLLDKSNSPYDYMSIPFSEETKNLSRSMMNAWGSFAKKGLPKYLTSERSEVSWPPFDNNNQTYVHFTTDMTPEARKSKLLPQPDSFWNELLPALRRKLLLLSENEADDTNGTTNTPTTISIEAANDTTTSSAYSTSADIADQCEYGGPSTISKTQAETALFLLAIVVICVLIFFVIILCGYCQLKQDMKAGINKQDDKSNALRTTGTTGYYEVNPEQ